MPSGGGELANKFRAFGGEQFQSHLIDVRRLADRLDQLLGGCGAAYVKGYDQAVSSVGHQVSLAWKMELGFTRRGIDSGIVIQVSGAEIGKGAPGPQTLATD